MISKKARNILKVQINPIFISFKQKYNICSLAQMYEDKECSHIVNIFEKTQNPPPNDRGNLFLSGVITLKKVDKMKEYNISCVVSIIDEVMFKHYKVKQKIEHLQIKQHKWIDIQDDQEENIYPHLDEIHSYVKEMLQNRNVLIHCQMGISRSASLVIAFLMKEYGLNYNQAKLLTKNKRRHIEPNERFQQDLLKFEEYLKINHPQLFENKQKL